MQLFGFARSFFGDRREEDSKPAASEKRVRLLRTVNECGEDVYIEVECKLSTTEAREILRKKCAHLTGFLLSTRSNLQTDALYNRLVILNRRILAGEENITDLYDEYHAIKTTVKRTSRSIMNLSGLDNL